MPTSQSASERDRAARSSGSICSRERMCANPSWIACFVMLEIQRRSTGLSTPAVSHTYAKINSPSRPESQALTTRSTSALRSSLWITFSCFVDFGSRGFSLNSPGRIGRSAIRHFLSFSS